MTEPVPRNAAGTPNAKFHGQLQNRKRFYERAVKKKVSPEPPKVAGS